MSQDEIKNKARPVNKVLMTLFLLFTIACSIVSIYYSNRTQETEKAKIQASRQRLLEETLNEKKAAAEKVAATAAATPDPGAGFSLKVQGDDAFQKQAMQALQLIWQYDKPTFDDIKHYVYIIRPGNKTDFVLENNTPTIVLTSTTAFRSTTWCAGAIGRQFFHAKRYYDREKLKSQLSAPPEPGQPSHETIAANPLLFDFRDAATVEKMEKEADVFHADLLRKLGAPRLEIALVEKRTPFDYSLVNDGE
jgi:preprotein translocase subunit SecG